MATTKKAKSPRRKAAPARTKAPVVPIRGKRRARAAVAAATRRAEVLRETSETRISVRVAIEEPGYQVATGVPFLDHMLEALSRHSNIGLVIAADGDTHID